MINDVEASCKISTQFLKSFIASNLAASTRTYFSLNTKCVVLNSNTKEQFLNFARFFFKLEASLIIETRTRLKRIIKI